jgi:hypothetical protein
MSSHTTPHTTGKHTKTIILHSTQRFCLFLEMTNNNNTLQEEDPEGDEGLWLLAIRQSVGKHPLFGNIQFITCEVLVCRKLPGCTIEKQELFWKQRE